ncbi:ogr/Delta-like zinc finger family protein [Vibrio splendidus]|uniref:ogr/Delta-like zinc finger family protein n=1 Tax=Vibrio splendidus TaxID=29497 RepID=UPI003551E035
MYVTCPACHCKANIISRKAEDKKKSLLTCQCSNLNCSSSFKLGLSLVGSVLNEKKGIA